MKPVKFRVRLNESLANLELQIIGDTLYKNADLRATEVMVPIGKLHVTRRTQDIVLHSIYLDVKSTGLGTKIVLCLLELADRMGLGFLVMKPHNSLFWRKFYFGKYNSQSIRLK